jgi:hypothetical protein
MVYNAAITEDASAIQCCGNVQKSINLVRDISNNRIHSACQMTVLFTLNSMDNSGLKFAKQKIEIICELSSTVIFRVVYL